MPFHRHSAFLSTAVAVTVAALLTPAVQATVAFDGSTYSQDFNTLPTNATTDYRTWYDDSANPPATGGQNDPGASLPGWFIQTTKLNSVATGGYQRFRVSTGSQNTGSLYSFGSSLTNTDRALGTIGSSTVGTQYFALRLENTTNQVITSFTLSYDGEQYRDGGNASGAAQQLTFGYEVEAGSIQDSSFTNVSALNFVSPVHGTSAATLNGNLAANRVAGITSTITGLNWEPGQDLWLRWSDVDDTGNDHGLAIDNLVFNGTLSGQAGTAGSPTWKTDADATWSSGDTSNWLNGNAPSGTAGLVRLGSQITADRTVTLGTSPSVDTLEFNGGAHNYTLAATGSNQLNINAGGSIVTNGVSFLPDNTPSNGNQISAPLNFASNAEFQVNDPLARLTVSGQITVGSGGGLHKTGNGGLVLTHANSYSGPTVIDGGSVGISDGNQLGDNSPTNGITVNNGGQLMLNADLTMSRSVTFAGDGGVGTDFNANLGGAVNAPATSIFTKSGTGTINVSSLHTGAVYIVGDPSSAPAGVLQVLPNGTDTGTSKISFIRLQTDSNGIYLGKFDITNNAVVVDYTGTTPLTNSTSFTSAGGTTLGSGSKIATALWYAFDGGHWDRTGITSSLATTAVTDPPTPTSAYSVAYAEASGLLGLSGTATATWHGQTVDATSVLLMYTLAGDANMNGKIDADDYAIVDKAIATSAFTTVYTSAADAGLHAQWINGDFNYDGAVNVNDLALLDKSLATQNGGSLSPAFLAMREAQYGDAYVTALIASIPEPTTLGLVLAAGLPLMARRRQRRQV